MKHNPGFLKLVEEAKARVRQTNVQEVMKRMEKGERSEERRVGKECRL